ncbi:Arylsulfatase A [Williamsia sterculiae]|uniref:Arylsulfatase A n=2 Tax=Williamsia sterculiae TaxID=1344003 RepID=A0A1N7DR76_9NOCA|nr:sulfatase [Williamsia sterculiae]SIR78299.1 Arylsulfatase A [Williamsia sterculiae]
MSENVLFIHWHDLGRHLGCYGAAGVSSPVMDALAASGIRCADAHSTAPLCSPARGSLFTGRYPHSNGLTGLAHHGFEYHDDVATLPERLRDRGYQTALFGMQHESSDPTSIGFDEVDVSDSQCDHVVALSQQWLRDRAERADDRPFFLTAGFFETHRPYPADQYHHADPDRVVVPDFLEDSRPVREDVAGLHGSIEKADAAVGRLLHTVGELGLAETTWVVFITDHGLAFPRAKSTLYAPGTGVALIIRPPARRGVAPYVYDDLFSGVDLAPTVLDLLGAPIPDDIEGYSHAEALLAGVDAATVRGEVFTEKTYHDNFDPIRAVRTRTHSYIENYADRPALSMPLDIRDSLSAQALDGTEDLPRAPRELYDLTRDPFERDNVVDDPAYAEVVADLANRLHSWRSTTNDTLPSEAHGNAVARDFMRRHREQLNSAAAREAGRSLPSRRPRGDERELHPRAVGH